MSYLFSKILPFDLLPFSVFAYFFAVIAFVSTVYVAWIAFLNRRFNQWISTPVKLESFELDASPSGEKFYLFKVCYSFNYRGVQYTSSRVLPTSLYCKNMQNEIRQEIKGNFDSGTPMVVWVDPKWPKLFGLYRKISVCDLVLSLFVAFFSALILLLYNNFN